MYLHISRQIVLDLSTRAVPVGRPGDVHDTGGEFSFSDYKFMQLEVSAIGYFRLMEADILVLKLNEPGEFRWNGSMLNEARDGKGVLMYRLIEPPKGVVTWKPEKDPRN